MLKFDEETTRLLGADFSRRRRVSFDAVMPRPGGRAISDPPERMAKMVGIWDRHVAHRRLPQILPGALIEAGFGMETVIPFTTCDIDLRPDGLAQMMIRLMTGYAISTGAMPEDAAAAWALEQKTLAKDGRFWFTLGHFITVARSQ